MKSIKVSKLKNIISLARGTLAAGVFMYTLYSYYRSSCSWRVRLALELKEIPYNLIQINLLNDEQSSEEYLRVNPSGVVPALVVDGSGLVITQSVAILEFLEEAHPDRVGLLPSLADPMKRAKVRQLVQVIASDCQPLQNLHVLRRIVQVSHLKDVEEAKAIWGRVYIERALKAFEVLFVCDCNFQEEPISLADLCLIPQLYNARRFGIDVELDFPQLALREKFLLALHPMALKNAHPDSEINK
jgi:maleylacetoacetate isomerase